jgi:hypothetical protein
VVGPVVLTAGPVEDPPPAPDDLAAVAASDTEIDLAWGDVEGETRYELRRQTRQVDGTWGAWEPAATLGENAISHRDEGLTEWTTYRHSLRACNPVGCSGWVRGPAVLTAEDVADLPPPPAGFGASAVSPARIDLNWSDVEGETHYILRRRARAGGIWGAWERIATVDADLTTFADTDLPAGDRFRYGLRACRGDGCSDRVLSDPVSRPLLVVLWDNGGLITHAGMGAGGADASMASELNLHGVNVRHYPPDPWFRIADNFTIGSGAAVTSIVTYSYDQGDANWSGYRMNIWSGLPGDPGSSILAATTSATRAFTGIYRVSHGAENLLETDRPIEAITWDLGTLVLEPGTYWIDWQTWGGTGTYGAWAPPVMEINPEDADDPIMVPGDARHLVQLDGGGWQDLLAFMGTTAETPFLVVGSVSSEALAAGLPTYQPPRPARPAPRLRGSPARGTAEPAGAIRTVDGGSRD